MHVSTVSRIVLRVSTAIARLGVNYIKFPETTSDILKTKREFFEITSFPNVISAIDGTHVRKFNLLVCFISSSCGLVAEVYRNRKSYFIVNVQAACNAKMIFTNVVERWPVSTHDATIFNNSRLRHIFEGDFLIEVDGFILGDSAYPQKSYMMTPLLNPRTSAEQLYNESQIRSRIGILKRRYPVLAYGVRLKLSTVLTIIIATCVLHNMMRQNGIIDDPPESLDFSEENLQNAITNGQIENVNFNNSNLANV